MFKTLQRKLTLTYSLWFFLTLAALFIVLFFVFKSMIYQSVSWQVEDIARDQAVEFAERHHLEGSHFKHSLYLSAFLSENGEDVVYRGTMPDPLRHEFIARVAKKENWGLTKVTSIKGEKNYMVYAMEPVIENGHRIGYIVIAKGIRGAHELIERWFTLLFVLTLIAASLSIMIAHFLARRAVLPVKRNYEKQRTFVADASHEMRTPLSVFSAGLEYFEAEEKDRMSESSKETLADLKEEVSEMNTLISHLLTLAKSDREGIGVQRSDLKVINMIQSIASYYHQKALLEKKKFVLDLPQHELTIYANPIEIKQLLTIFLDNAFKYTKDADQIVLRIGADEKRHNFCFSTKDTGIGIPENEQKHIYERFYRIEKGRARKSGGNGLGLSIAREIVDAYKGSIVLESLQNKGTTFHITLPILKNIN
ncbi:sensor histidine kinase [Sporolactobacillus kofuensis]|uniref:histidine kinase n=1 Tax=Sporolactobacillus kofuensis TaxID=269672 RepID=A0ABW1WIW8_9BACL|nr:HAMP domain-containing sensor histidine kinase [Sporolactobacillus kofuensis]MCO7176528.1 HAMP domain-containing histidine kinase [Sporolactobacillus kofuensis]